MGWRRGRILAVVLGGALAWWAIFEPHFTFVPPLTFGDQLSVVIYVFASLMIVAGADYCRRLAKSLKDEEELRNLAVKELGHRLKNKVATIQSIIAFQLRGVATRDTILQRLAALSSADALIEATEGRGALSQDIIYAEIGPYDTSRASVKGPPIFLSLQSGFGVCNDFPRTGYECCKIWRAFPTIRTGFSLLVG